MVPEWRSVACARSIEHVAMVGIHWIGTLARALTRVRD